MYETHAYVYMQFPGPQYVLSLIGVDEYSVQCVNVALPAQL
jgi:hypothetical protein